MKKLFSHSLLAVSLLGLLGSVQSASAATTLDYSANFTSTNFGWLGSGQTINIPLVDNTLDFVTFFADEAATGQLFDIYVTDALNGGNTLFSNMNVPITGGANTFAINQSFTPGSQIYVQVDYNGYSGLAFQFGGDVYAGGNSTFGPVGGASSFGSLDHRFVAQFNGEGTPANTPDGGTTGLLAGMAFLGLFATKRVVRR